METGGGRRAHRIGLLVLAALVVSLASVEVIARLLVRPSASSAGRLLGVELPPLEVFPRSQADSQMGARAAERLFEGGPLTYGDLYGIFREDPALGYTVLESARSRNGWWQSDEAGARSRRPMAESDGSRLLVFGESFAQAGRVRQEDAWTSVLDSLCAELEVVNLGVDGYSMGQAYLRYHALGSVIEHDVVLMMFAPSADLWRELNTLRSLRGWSGVPLVPRFVLSGGELRVVERPYPDLSTVVEDNRSRISPRLHDHLKRYDRFYCPQLYAVPPILGDLMLYKITAAGWCGLSLRHRRSDLFEPEGEAVRIVQAIFAAARREAEANGARFVLAIVPTVRDVEERAANRGYAEALDELGRFFCAENECVDLTSGLSALAPHELDRGADGTHYGPLANRRIAEIFASRFACHEAASRRGGSPDS